MLYFQIDPHSGVPVYRQLLEQVKYYVASGTLRAGEKLPSIRELARALAVNPTTIVKAFSELEHEKVIELKHGKGAFVRAAGPRMTDTAREEVVRRLARQLAVEARQLGAPAELVLRLVKEQLDGMGTPGSPGAPADPDV